ncbi:MAG: NAD(P)/FAD-dependent oxidoreductase [Pseudomonadota bacterium]
MADKSFDAIIIGGGNKGLVTAMYLAKYGGMEVGIFERRHEIGGGWSSEESAAPGFITNTHMATVGKFYHTVMPWDFPDFEEKGGTWIPYIVAHGSIFEEDQSCLGIYGEDYDYDQTKSAKEIARFSQRDADTWMEWWKKWKEKIEPAFLKTIYNPAYPAGVPDPLEQALMDPQVGVEPVWAVKSPIELLRDLFESEALVAHFLRTVHAWSGNNPPDIGAAAIAQLLGNFLFTQYGCIEGGSHSWAHACHKIYLENGGKSLTKHEVEKVLIENGKARGVRLTDGSEIEARKLVVSTLDPYTLCFKLMGEEYFSPRTLRRVKYLSRRNIAITWYHWAVHELPHYKAAGINPDIDKCGALNLITKDPEALIREDAWKKLGKMPPDLNLMVWSHSIVDPKQAPKGKYTVASEQFVLSADKLSEKEWREFKKKHAEDVIKHWSKYAPNMTWENVIGYDPLTPFDCTRLINMGPVGNWGVIDNIPSQTGRNRPVPELARHRTPVERLYATGTAWPFTACGMTCQGYNCYKVIAEDFDVKKPWAVDGRPF